MKIINKNMKLFIFISVLLLCGSIFGMSGIRWGGPESNIGRTFDHNLADSSSSDISSSARASSEDSRGSGGLQPIIDLNLTTGTAYPHQNMTIYGANVYDYAGYSVATGDVDGDGIKDTIIGAYLADGPSNRIDCGAAYVIYGSTSLPSIKNLTAQADITIYGIDPGDQLGWAVSAAGSVNADNIDDIIIGAPSASGPINKRSSCGEIYVILGSASLATTIDLNTTAADIIIYGQEDWDNAGYSVTAGDVNSDTKDDIIIGSISADGPNSKRSICGEVYIINGTTFSPPTSIDLNTTAPSTIIYGADLGDQTGISIATGDIDGSGKEDLIIGAPSADGPGNLRANGCGDVYLIYGSSSLASSIDLNTGAPGTHADVIIYGVDGGGKAGDQTGYSVAAGDVCGDNIDDIIIGAQGADGPSNARTDCGEVYIIKGRSNFLSTIDLDTGAGGAGPDIIIYGSENNDKTGNVVSAGDINGDNKDDILIGAYQAYSGPNNNRVNSGEVYIINGSSSLPPTIDINTTNPVASYHHNVTIWGVDSDDNAGCSIAAGDINDDTIEDLIIGAYQAAGFYNNKAGSGEIYAVFGSPEANFNPSIVTTVPSNGTTGVALDAPIIVNFSEPMNPLTVQFTLNPTITLTPTWNAANTGVNFTHTTNFQEKMLYQMKITAGLDATGKSIIQHPKLLIPNPWNFTTGDFTEPQVTLTDPANNTVNVEVNKSLKAVFSEPMNRSTLQYTCEPDPLGWSLSWNETNETVIFDHNDFQEQSTYWFNITGCDDYWDLPLVDNPGVPRHIYFTTGDFTAPNITITLPKNNSINVDLDTSIEVTFSESIDKSTASLVCDPNPGGWSTGDWSDNDKKVIYNHTNDFEYNTWYNVTIATGAKDPAGNELVTGDEPNPWRFKTIGLNPVILSTDPLTNSKNVSLNKDIVITFSKPMKKDTITWSCNPLPNGGFTAYWDAYNEIVTLKHNTEFEKLTTYKFEITGGNNLDEYDLELDINNPIYFKTVGDNPLILETTPANDTINVYMTADVIVKFNEPMNTGTVQFTCTPDPGGWQTPVWNALNDEVTYSHSSPFTKNTKYTCEITAGKDLDDLDLIPGILNPWSFTTTGDNPLIIDTIPKKGATQVLLNADIIVKFSKDMDTDTVQIDCTPAVAGGFTPVWNLDKTEVKYKHTTEFTKDTLYTFNIKSAKDQKGFDLIAGNIPNPWEFRTIGDNPIISKTDPVHNSAGIPLDADIIVEFNEPMSASAITYICSPLPSGDFKASWNAGEDIVTFKHTTNFEKNTLYTFEITAGKDLDGFDLVEGNIPNPWSFRTIGEEPVIYSTSPRDGDINMDLNKDIIVTFTESMAINSVTFHCTPDPNPGGWTIEWNEDNRIVTFIHTTHFEKNTEYKFEITGGIDLDDYALISGPVPNPWKFTTGSEYITDKLPTVTLLEPPDKSTVNTLKPQLKWKGNNSIEYNIYLGLDKTNVANLDNSLLVATQESLIYTPTNNLALNTTYFWTVIPSNETDNGICLNGVWSFTTPHEEKVKRKAEDWTLMIILLVIVVIIIILITAIMFFRVKKKRQPPGEEEPSPPTVPLPQQAGVGPATTPQVPAEQPSGEAPPPPDSEPTETAVEDEGHPVVPALTPQPAATPSTPQPAATPPTPQPAATPSTTQPAATPPTPQPAATPPTPQPAPLKASPVQSPESIE